MATCDTLRSALPRRRATGVATSLAASLSLAVCRIGLFVVGLVGVAGSPAWAQTEVDTGFSGTIGTFDIISLVAPGGTVNGPVTNNGELWFNNPDIATQTISAPISGSGLVVFWQPVTVTLSGSNSYLGGTFLYDGTTNISGSLTGGGIIELDGVGGPVPPVPLFSVSGTVASGQVTLALSESSFGNATVLNGGSWTSAADFYAGFGAGGQSVVTVSGGTATFGNAYFGNSVNSVGTLNLSGGTFSTSGSGDAYFGYLGTSTVAVSGGTLSAGGDLYISYQNNASATLSGTGSISAGDTLFVGFEGVGGLTVDGGTLSSASGVIGQSTGGVGTVTMNASTWAVTNDLFVGRTTGGNGTLLLSGGGATAARVFVGDLSGSTGAVTISNAASTLSLTGTFPEGNLLVGNSGTGTMTISAGGVTAAGGSLGVSTSGNGTVAVSGGQLDVSGLFNIGLLGTGGLTLSSGTLKTDQVIVGADFFTPNRGSGTVNITGGTWNNSLSLTVGQNGNGTYTQSGGSVSVAGNSYIGSANTAATSGTGSVTVTGGTLAYAGNLDVGNAQAGSTGSGTLTIGTAGLVSVADTLTRIAANGTITINAGGTLSIGTGGATGTLATDLIANNGLVIFNRTTNYTYAGSIAGSGGVTKQGGSILTLSDVSSYAGATTVAAGTLNLTGQLGSTAVTVQAGATLTGTGSVAGGGSVAVAAGGTISPGVSGVGSLTIGNYSMASTATAIMEITNSTVGTFDSIVAQSLSNTLAWGNGSVSITMSTTPSYAEGTTFPLFSGFGSYTGTIAGITFDGTGTNYAGLSFDPVGSGLWRTAQNGSGQLLEFNTFTGNLVVVPEPSGVAMIAAAAAAVGLYGGAAGLRGRRRRCPATDVPAAC
jgi:T5SS/PEP-CTERM-associated repeat protein/autotransporter-associated beta strand protein